MRGGGVVVFGSGTSPEVSRIGEDHCVDLVRSSGILLHPTSLPGGRLGDEAYRFVDWLAAAGQSWWQVLPLGPPDTDGSPYNASSAFADFSLATDDACSGSDALAAVPVRSAETETDALVASDVVSSRVDAPAICARSTMTASTVAVSQIPRWFMRALLLRAQSPGSGEFPPDGGLTSGSADR